MKNSKIVMTMLAGTAMMAAVMPVAVRADDKDDGSTTVNISAEARRMVQQDRVQAVLAIEVTGKSPEAVQAEINTKMQKAKAVYGGVAGVKPTTGGYNVWKDYPPQEKPLSEAEREKTAYWRGSQDLRLDGATGDEIMKLVASLQKQGFATRGLNFYMSREAEDKIKDALIVEALDNIKARGQNVQQALGMKTIHYSRIDLGSYGSRPPMPMMARAMKTEAYDAAGSMPMPIGEAGESEVVVSVSAEVKLK